MGPQLPLSPWSPHAHWPPAQAPEAHYQGSFLSVTAVCVMARPRSGIGGLEGTYNMPTAAAVLGIGLRVDAPAVAHGLRCRAPALSVVAHVRGALPTRLLVSTANQEQRSHALRRRWRRRYRGGWGHTTLPQAPQFWGSVCVLTHRLLQAVCGGEHTAKRENPSARHTNVQVGGGMAVPLTAGSYHACRNARGRGDGGCNRYCGRHLEVNHSFCY